MDEEPELLDPNADDEVEGDPTEQDLEADPPGDEADGEGSDLDEVVITIGDEAPPPEEQDETRAPDWVRELRKSNREKDRQIRELESKVRTATPQPAEVVLGPKPKLDDAGIDFDTDKHVAALESWFERKQAADAEARKRQEAADAGKRAWDARLANHAKLAAGLKVKDWDDAKGTVEDALSQTQQGLIVHGAENSAVLMYAIGKNPKTLKDLAAITDPVLFAFAVAKLETKLKVTARKTAPVPEREIRGNASPSGSIDSALDKLRKEADKTGDRTRVAAYMRAQKLKQRA